MGKFAEKKYMNAEFGGTHVVSRERYSPLITQGGPMISIPQVGSVLCGLALLLTASYASAQAPNDLTHNRTIKGDVSRIDYAYYVVKEKDGREVRVHADKTTQMMGQLKQGDRVEAEVTAENHILRMRPLP
jgi:hypothetical protein